ncbi:hypothetical protein B0H11DRAFT_1135479 [Mycena galericulata]|nr:hypothetical protein B0H11DRAFT_1135479 [Mycena galericulata]
MGSDGLRIQKKKKGSREDERKEEIFKRPRPHLRSALRLCKFNSDFLEKKTSASHLRRTGFVKSRVAGKMAMDGKWKMEDRRTQPTGCPATVQQQCDFYEDDLDSSTGNIICGMQRRTLHRPLGHDTRATVIAVTVRASEDAPRVTRMSGTCFIPSVPGRARRLGPVSTPILTYGSRTSFNSPNPKSHWLHLATRAHVAGVQPNRASVASNQTTTSNTECPVVISTQAWFLGISSFAAGRDRCM